MMGAAAPAPAGAEAPPAGVDDVPREKPFRLLYPVGSRKWNCRASPHKRADLLGAYVDGTTVLAKKHPNGWLELRLPSGEVGWCKQFDAVHMMQHHRSRMGMGWYEVSYGRLADDAAWGMALETLTPPLHQALVEGRGQGRCAGCRLAIKPGSLAYIGSCGHSFHYDCLKQLGDTNICTACGVWYAIGQAPPAECPAPAPTSFFQHVHQALWFVPPFYRYLLIYAAMLIAFPFVLLASYLGLV